MSTEMNTPFWLTFLGDIPVFWGRGDKEKFQVAEILSNTKLPSKTVVNVDSIATTIMFESCFPDVTCSRMQMLSECALEKLDLNTREAMEDMYRAYRRRFEKMGEADWAAWYITTTADLTSKFWNEFPILRRGGSPDALKWYVIFFRH